MTAPSDASRRPRDAGLFTVMRRAGPRNVSVPSAQSRYARVPTNSQSRSLIRNRRVLYQLLCAVSLFTSWIAAMSISPDFMRCMEPGPSS
jgi:hypothetical protein